MAMSDSVFLCFLPSKFSQQKPADVSKKMTEAAGNSHDLHGKVFRVLIDPVGSILLFKLFGVDYASTDQKTLPYC